MAVDLELFAEAYNNFGDLYGNGYTEMQKKKELASSFNINIRTVYKLLHRAISQNLIEDMFEKEIQEVEKELVNITADDFVSQDKKSIHRLTEENKQLKKLLEDTKTKVFNSDDIKEVILGVKEIGFDTIPKWIQSSSESTNTLVPVLFLTDLHLGEVVSASDMGFTEEYNKNICINSTNKITEDFIDICNHKMSNYNYNGCVLLLGGDGITGNLHDLAETNDLTPISQVIELTSLYIQQIEKLKSAFGKVAVFAVSGNHGRYDAHNYTKMKKRTENSLETIVYHFTSAHFKDDEHVSIITDNSDEVTFGINGRKFKLMHGDRGISGGNGIGGIIVPIKRARAKMLQNAVAMGKSFQTLVIGHFHQHFVSDSLIIGNSVKCFDEYSLSMGFEYSSAGATSWFVNTSGDIIFATDIKVREENKIKNTITKSIELF